MTSAQGRDDFLIAFTTAAGCIDKANRWRAWTSCSAGQDLDAGVAHLDRVRLRETRAHRSTER